VFDLESVMRERERETDSIFVRSRGVTICCFDFHTCHGCRMRCPQVFQNRGQRTEQTVFKVTLLQKKQRVPLSFQIRECVGIYRRQHHTKTKQLKTQINKYIILISSNNELTKLYENINFAKIISFLILKLTRVVSYLFQK